MERPTSAMRDDLLMRHALDLATHGPLGDPNPRVGAVILDASGDVVGEGWHRGAGTPHAEPAALAQAGERARGGTAYVTLEPCNHHGRTPACSEALIAAGVSRVVAAMPDPHGVAAGGADRLREAGIDVHVGLLADDAAALNREWLFSMTHGRPFVTWKVASTLDGRIAAADGSSRWITGAAARAEVHTLRARAGAVLVGTGTAVADDPSLTVRDAEGRLAARQPLRVVAGRRAGSLPADARVRDEAAPSLLVESRDPHDVLARIRERDVHHVLLEGGATLVAAFWRAGLVDEVVAYLAPALLGAGAASLSDFGVGAIGDAVRLQVKDVAIVGDDVRIIATPRTAAGQE